MSFYSTPVVSSPIAQTQYNITTAVSITSGYNGFSISPVTIAPGGSVTVPSGSKWVIVNYG